MNLWGVIHGIRTFVPIMLEQGTEGHIVNTASVAGLLVSGFKSSYDVSKFGVVALSESLYRELDALGSPVKVSVLCPGLVQTRIMTSRRNRPGRLENDAAVESAGQRPEAVAYWQASRTASRHGARHLPTWPSRFSARSATSASTSCRTRTTTTRSAPAPRASWRAAIRRPAAERPPPPHPRDTAPSRPWP